MIWFQVSSEDNVSAEVSPYPTSLWTRRLSSTRNRDQRSCSTLLRELGIEQNETRTRNRDQRSCSTLLRELGIEQNETRTRNRDQRYCSTLLRELGIEQNETRTRNRVQRSCSTLCRKLNGRFFSGAIRESHLTQNTLRAVCSL